MREMKNNRVIKRILSGVMAFAVALTMCMVAMPTRVLAEDVGYQINADGTIVTPTTGTGIGYVFLAEGTTTSIESLIGIDTTSKTITLKGGNIKTISMDTSGYATYNVQGANKVDQLWTSDATLTINMTPGSSLEVPELYIQTNPKTTLADAYAAGKIKVNGGEIKDGKLVATGELKVGDEAQESGKTEDEAPTYKITKKEGDNREVAYVRPAKKAENIQETEEVKAEVTLIDGQIYKVTEISDNAFSAVGGKEKIKTVKIGKNVKKIGKGAFSGCTNLKTADLPDELEEIGESAFEKTEVTSVTLGKKVKKVGKKAYYNCGKLKKVIVKTAKLTKKGKVGKNAFKKTNKKLKVKMKMSKKDAKKAKEPTIKVFKQKKIGYVNTWTVS